MHKGRLTFIGLGLYDERDISLKGLEEIKKSDKVYAEFYTSKLTGTDVKNIEETIGKPIEILSRDETEKGEKILNSAISKNVVFLTAGDPMTATTHVDLRLRAIKKEIKTKVVHSSSIITAVSGLLGLQNYKFGRATTLAYPEKNYFPTSPYDIIKENQEIGLHTLILLDIQEDKNRYMTANEGLKLLIKMEEKQKSDLIHENSLFCIVARAGSDKPIVTSGSIKDLIKKDFGPPLHTMVMPGKLHFMEIEALQTLAQLPAQQVKKLQKL
ncbi:diphthine synthase [Thermoplasmatales archaeon SG8-52-4]|nr:MAG: diphthine synthase [Thermoplasmatales archaeon SG8-52-4]